MGSSAVNSTLLVPSATLTSTGLRHMVLWSKLFVDTTSIRDLSPPPYTFQNLIGKGKPQ
jgi:hypothetical protein